MEKIRLLWRVKVQSFPLSITICSQNCYFCSVIPSEISPMITSSHVYIETLKLIDAFPSMPVESVYLLVSEAYTHFDHQVKVQWVSPDTWANLYIYICV